jgi:hypothetical protein
MRAGYHVSAIPLSVEYYRDDSGACFIFARVLNLCRLLGRARRVTFKSSGMRSGGGKCNVAVFTKVATILYELPCMADNPV